MKKILIILLAILITSFFFACVTPTTYTVTMNANIGTGTGSYTFSGDGTYGDGASVTLQASNLGTDAFIGWYSDATGTTLISNQNPYTFNISSNMNVYPKVNIATTTYTVTMNANIGTGTGSYTFSGDGTYGDGASVTLQASNLGTDAFIGWYSDATGTTLISDQNPYTFNISSNMNVYPMVDTATTTYTVTMNANIGTGTGSYTFSGDGTYGDGASVTLQASNLGTDAFIGWYSDATGTTLISNQNPYTFNISSNMNVYPMVDTATTTYTVTMNANIGTGTGSYTFSGDGTYGDGASVTLQASNLGTDAFIGWYSDATGTTLISDQNPYTFNISSNMNVYPMVDTATTTYTVSSGTVTGGTIDSGLGSYVEAANVVITATATTSGDEPTFTTTPATTGMTYNTTGDTWEYSFTMPASNVTVDVVFTAPFVNPTFPEGFEGTSWAALTTGNTWTLGGTSNPTLGTIMYHSGTKAAQFPYLTTAGNNSYFEIQVNYPTERVVSFWYYKSAAVSTSASFKVDGVSQWEVTATMYSWTQVSVNIPSGPQTLRWEFTNVSGASSSVYIDDIDIAPVSRTLEVKQGSTVINDDDTNIQDIGNVDSAPFNFVLKNTGNAAITISSVNYTDTTELTMTPFTPNTVINPGASVNLTFTATASSSDSGIITINSNADGTQSTYTFKFSCNFILTTTITIGTGTSTGHYLPVDDYYHDQYSQTIYLKSEIGDQPSKKIDKIRLQIQTLNATAWYNPVTIYIGHTSKTQFASTNDWEPIANLTQVWSGNITVSNLASGTWYEIVLTTSFDYNNTDNLVIAYDQNEADWGTNRSGFAGTSGTARSLSRYYDSGDIDPATPGTGTLKDYFPNIQIVLSNQ